MPRGLKELLLSVRVGDADPLLCAPSWKEAVSCFNGEDGLERAGSEKRSIPASSDLSGTISVGSADRLGLLPGIFDVIVGERGTLHDDVLRELVESPSTDSLSLLATAAREAAAMLAFDLLFVDPSAVVELDMPIW